MKIAMIALAFVMLLQASPEKKTEVKPAIKNIPEPDTLYNSEKGGFDTEHPPLYWTYKYDTDVCSSYFIYNKDTHICTMTIRFNIPDSQIVCSPLQLSMDGFAELTCSYMLKKKEDK